MKSSIAIATMALGVFAFAAHAAIPEPVVWFVGDRGVITNASGKVTAWQNQGSLKSGELVEVVANSQDSTISIVNNSFLKHRPCIRFLGDEVFLRSAGATDLDLNQSDGLTVFTVSYCMDLSKSGVYALDSDQTGVWRFGRDIHPTARLRRVFFFAMNYSQPNTVFPALTPLLDSTFACITSGGTFLNTFTSGKPEPQRPGLPKEFGTVRSATFSVGRNLLSETGFHGDIAEIRIYNRVLTPAERLTVDGELAVRYGNKLMLDETSTLTTDMLGDCDRDVAVIGYALEGGRDIGEPPASATSGALTISREAPVDKNLNTLVCAVRDHYAGTDCTWCIGGSEAARQLPLALAFTGSEFASTPHLKLFYQADKNSNAENTGIEPEYAGNGLVFALPAGWANGRYFVRTRADILRPAVWFKADVGVTTNAGGVVTKWENQGMLGDVLDMTPSAATDGITLASNAFGTKPAVRFDGTDYLKSASATDFDLTSQGGAWFIVANGNFSDYDSNRGFFGLDNGGSTAWRFGLFSVNRCRLCAAFFAKPDNGGVSSFDFCDGTKVGGPGNFAKTHNGEILGKNIWVSTAYVFQQPADIRQYGFVAGKNYDDIGSGYSFPGWSAWSGIKRSGEFRLGHSGISGTAWNNLVGDIAEFRLYNQPLTSAERASIELELALAYGLRLETFGGVDVADHPEISAHRMDSNVFGTQYNGGRLAEPGSAWADDMLEISKTSAFDLMILTCVGSDGAEKEDRTWHVLTTGTNTWNFTFTPGGRTAGKTYVLQCKEKGASDFAALDVEPTIGEHTVSFALESMSTGTYRLRTHPAGTLFFLR
ncbi:MAG: hypothetical protein ACOX5G_02135 [Kiritimatiellia bacterium]|jgi:hypothetical protein